MPIVLAQEGATLSQFSRLSSFLTTLQHPNSDFSHAFPNSSCLVCSCLPFILSRCHRRSTLPRCYSMWPCCFLVNLVHPRPSWPFSSNTMPLNVAFKLFDVAAPARTLFLFSSIFPYFSRFSSSAFLRRSCSGRSSPPWSGLNAPPKLPPLPFLSLCQVETGKSQKRQK